MPTYAIGDVHGCYDPLCRLLEQINFDSSQDALWFAGDLINRGPQSLEVLQLIRQLGSQAYPILGNHDFHLLMQYLGYAKPHVADTLAPILTSPDVEDWVNRVRHWPLIHTANDYLMVHAGLLPQWHINDAPLLAQEVEQVLRGPDWTQFLAVLYQNTPTRWQNDLTGEDRWRTIVSGMTRLRFCSPEGEMNFHAKGAPKTAPTGCIPWFEHTHRQQDDKCIITGHWSTLGLRLAPQHIALDTGCLWGGTLTAICLENRRIWHEARDMPTS